MFHSPSSAWPPLPPTGESEQDKAVRTANEKEAKRISDEIDRAIDLERQELARKKRSQVKILLLGQAESGKSTMLKNFQLFFAPKSFHAEAYAWRAVIYLNLVRHVNYILDLLSKGPEYGATPKLKSDHRWLKMRLAPLRQVEEILKRSLGAEGSEVVRPSDQGTKRDSRRSSEVLVGNGWKVLLDGYRNPRNSRFSDQDVLDDGYHVVDACREDIVRLWADQDVQAMLREREMFPQDQPGFFLDQADRIARLSYTPTTEDILRARLRTVGVEEHRLVMETAIEKGDEWIFYDVGGTRGQRAAWAPFFDDVNAIVFLCPVAAFDQVLVEDPSVNRFMDSYDLWKTICQSKLLSRTTFVLLLNKCDIMKAKLKSGILFANNVPQYTGANEFDAVIDYLKKLFSTRHRQYSPHSRQLYIHATCAIDTSMMAFVLGSIRDVILKNMLGEITLL